MNIKAIIFDLDQTLVDRTSTARVFLSDQYDRFVHKLSCGKEVFVNSVMMRQNNGYANKLVSYRQACQDLGESIPEELFDDFLGKYGSRAKCFDGISTVLEELFEKYRLAIVTNGRSRVQNAKIDSCEIRKFFSVIKISEEEGVKKPNREIYLRCLSDLNLSAQDCLFVGDNPDCDVVAPNEIGMKAAWVRNSHYEEPCEADAIVDQISDLLGLLN